jgi:hypothetical protein
MRRARLALVAALISTTAAACGSSSGGDAASKASPEASPSASPATLTVSMSIQDGAVLANAVTWEAKPTASDTDPISKVEFSIDGKVRWTEENEPYVFNDDGEVLPPWLLGNGAHVLAVHAVALSGAEGSATAHVTVRAETTANEALTGTYHRTVTADDQQRVMGYRTEDKGAFGDVSPPGEWTIKILPEGRIEGRIVTEPDSLFVVPFTVKGNRLTLYGSAVWLEPDPTKPDKFCEPERPSEYLWQRKGATVKISSLQQVCADRDIVFVGTWTPA